MGFYVMHAEIDPSYWLINRLYIV